MAFSIGVYIGVSRGGGVIRHHLSAPSVAAVFALAIMAGTASAALGLLALGVVAGGRRRSTAKG